MYNTAEQNKKTKHIKGEITMNTKKQKLNVKRVVAVIVGFLAMVIIATVAYSQTTTTNVEKLEKNENIVKGEAAYFVAKVGIMKDEVAEAVSFEIDEEKEVAYVEVGQNKKEKVVVWYDDNGKLCVDYAE